MQRARARGGTRLWGNDRVGRVGGEEITLGEEVRFVLPTPHSKDPVALVWVGRVEEERLPGALGAKSGITGWAGPSGTGVHVPRAISLGPGCVAAPGPPGDTTGSTTCRPLARGSAGRSGGAGVSALLALPCLYPAAGG